MQEGDRCVLVASGVFDGSERKAPSGPEINEHSAAGQKKSSSCTKKLWWKNSCHGPHGEHHLCLHFIILEMREVGCT